MIKKPISIGERVCIKGYSSLPAKIKEIEFDPSLNSTRLILEWAENVLSKVWLHDENKVWYRFDEAN